MVEDGVELRVDTLLHQLRRVIAVDSVHFVIDKALQILGRIFYLRREQILGQQLYIIDLSGNGVGVCDDDLFCKLIAEVCKLGQHLIGRAEEYRAAAVGIGELLCSLQYLAVLLVLLVEKMHIACGDDGLIELTAYLYDAAVVVLKHRLVPDNAVIDKEVIVAYRLNFKVIIERSYAPQLGIRCSVHDRTVKLAHAAGRADQYALSVLNKQAFRHGRGLVVILEIRL